MMMLTGIVIVLVFIVLLCIGSLFVIYNSLITLKNNIGKAWSNIDVLLKRRHDELTKLLDSVKGYMEFERNVLTQITAARSASMQAQTIPEKARADSMMSSTVKSLFAVAENYPELKASASFVQFQSRISEIESEIAERREYYNDAVFKFNSRIKQFPDMVISRFMQYTAQDYFKAAEEDTKDVKIQF
jgi:LemA protein